MVNVSEVVTNFSTWYHAVFREQQVLTDETGYGTSSAGFICTTKQTKAMA